MKNKLSLFIKVAVLLLLCSCAQEKKGVMYAPDKDSENGTALTCQNGANVMDTSSATNEDIPITLTILTSPQGAMMSGSADKILVSKLINIVAANGVGCVGGDPCFVLLMQADKLSESLTATVPTKHSVTYNLNVYVGNIITGNVYASYSTEIAGIGASKEKAEISAARSLKNAPGFRKMLEQASSRIINSYHQDSLGFFNRIKELETQGKYELMACMLKNVPTAAGGVYLKSQEMLPRILYNCMEKNSSELLAAMKGIATNTMEYNPQIVALYNSIPQTSPLKAEAKSLLQVYTNSLDENTRAAIQHERYKEQEELAIRKMEVQLNIEATEELLNVYRKSYATVQGDGASSGSRQPLKTPGNNSGTDGIFNSLLGSAVNVGMDLLMGYLF